LGANAYNWVGMATWSPGPVHPCYVTLFQLFMLSPKKLALSKYEMLTKRYKTKNDKKTFINQQQ
jgi:hypothetical protein